MAVTAPTRRPGMTARRVGYVIAVAVNVALLYLVNVWPGWSGIPFLTDETTAVLGIVNVSLAVGVVANLLYVAYDSPTLKALGDFVTTGIALGVLIRVWQVFPFDFDESAVNWHMVVRSVLVVALLGTIVGLVVQFLSVLRAVLRH